MPARRVLLVASIAAQVVVAALVATLLVGTAPGPDARAATAYADGSTPANAAGSCWEIKQGFPTKPSGAYWIVTPAMPAPMRLYCDQTTDGGGWVMIARGRERWTEAGGGTVGSGTWPSTLAVDGTAGEMIAKQLPGATIDQIVGNQRIDSLTDGIRLRRAANTSGTSWQELRVRLSKRDRWSWAFGSRLGVKSYSVNGTTNTKAQEWGDLRISGKDDSRRTWSRGSTTNGWVRGFNYGKTGPTGSTSASSYLYSERSDKRYATPFTQMFLRPKLIRSQQTFAAIADSGTRAITNRPVAQSHALPSRWGVTGLGKGGSIDTATEVSAFLQIGSTMYVGGNFTQVRDNQTGTSYPQSYLAAFDVNTGDWISSFRPKLDNQVKALAELNGQLVVGGQFTTVNGETRHAVASISPTSAALTRGFFADLRMTTKGSKLWVRSLLVSGDRLYVGGQFTHVRGGRTSTTWAPRNNITRLQIDGTPEAWAPNLGTGLKHSSKVRSPFSSVNSMTTRDGVLYVAGHFAQAYMRAEDGKATIAKKSAAAITMGDTATFRTWNPTFSTARERSQFQSAVLSAGDFIWLGGSQHALARYRPANMALAGGNLTFNGGDFQSLATGDGVVYGGCHCNDWVYQDTMAFDGRKLTGYTQADRIGYVGAWDARTGAYRSEFAPTLTARNGEGAWALKVASNGVLWAGGSFTAAVTTDGKTSWVGGFARFPATPSTAPGAPSNLRSNVSGDQVSLSWSASPTSGVSYEVLQDDRVVAFAGSATSLANLTVTGTARLFVRAVDAAGNRSASTPVNVVRGTTPPVQPEEPVPTVTHVPAGSSWSFSREQTGLGWANGSWTGTWRSGKAPLGWGSASLGTTLLNTPGVVYLRRDVTLERTDGTVLVTTRADDGAALYVNGVEIARRNLPGGTLTGSTRATASPSGTALDWTVRVPTNLLEVGKNVVAVEVHSSSDATKDVFFDATVTQAP